MNTKLLEKSAIIAGNGVEYASVLTNLQHEKEKKTTENRVNTKLSGQYELLLENIDTTLVVLQENKEGLDQETVNKKITALNSLRAQVVNNKGNLDNILIKKIKQEILSIQDKINLFVDEYAGGSEETYLYGDYLNEHLKTFRDINNGVSSPVYAKPTNVNELVTIDGELYSKIPENEDAFNNPKIINGLRYFPKSAPDTINVDGVTYYRNIPSDVTKEDYIITSYESEYWGVTYYSWEMIPESIKVNGVTYYKTAQEKPGENYSLVEYRSEKYQTTYYAWVEKEPAPQEAPESIEVNGVTYYKTAQEKPGENYTLNEYYSEEYQTTYYAWVEKDPAPQEAHESIEGNGVTYYKTAQEKPGENYTLTEYYSEEYQTTYYAWIENEPTPQQGFTYYLGNAPIDSSNYTSIAHIISEYPAEDVYSTGGVDQNVYILLKDNVNITAYSGMFVLTGALLEGPSFDGYKVLYIEETDGTITIKFQ